VLAGLAAELDAATQAMSRAQQDKTDAESALADQLTTWRATVQGHDPETNEQQITAMEAQLAALKSKYTDNHPDVKRLKRDIAAAKQAALDDQKVRRAIDTPVTAATEPPQIKALREKIHQFELTIQDRNAQQEETRRKIKVYQARVESTPAIAQEYKALTRDYQSALDFYNGLLKNRDLAAMATDLERQKQSEQFRVLDPPSFPDRPSFPKQLNFVVGGFGGGLALGLGLCLLLEVRDSSVRNERDVEMLLHLRVLAVVPALKKPSGGTKTNLSLEPVARL
jgi:uncharacterized protein involved in exopolysaccharide biosynthesis